MRLEAEIDFLTIIVRPLLLHWRTIKNRYFSSHGTQSCEQIIIL